MCIYLLYSAGWFDIAVGSLVVVVGIPLYLYFSPKTDIHGLKNTLISEEFILARNLERKNRFLANGVRLIASATRRARTRRATQK